ncbi:hypothetical protein BpHYR1_001795 [Brachionus plicatilis]|uniref:Uncharacterized protein n=1 Tax=Brachionus plicatilis TaxID=10195 RepID=A0A3M7RL38_BRAPC|nr:hypothetical protein BpHYR1_001795 [Brachionus plicatilis]
MATNYGELYCIYFIILLWYPYFLFIPKPRLASIETTQKFILLASFAVQNLTANTLKCHNNILNVTLNK